MWQLNERYALLFALLAPALLRPARGLRGAAPLLLVAATGLFAAANAGANIRAFDRESDRSTASSRARSRAAG